MSGSQRGPVMGELTSRWLCTLPQCRGQRINLHLCYHDPRSPEEPRNHFPIKAEALTFWADRILLKRATVEKPDQSTFAMIKNAGTGLNAPRKREPPIGTTPVAAQYQQPPPPGWHVPQQAPSPVYLNLAGLTELFQGVRHAHLSQITPAAPQQRPQLFPPSEAVVIPSSPTAYRRSTSPESQISAFFEWVREKYSHETFKDAESVLSRNGFILEDLRHSIQDARWLALDLKLGELPRIQRYLKEYKEAGLGRQLGDVDADERSATTSQSSDGFTGDLDD